ncbi:MAG: cohesin domain-containing protein, partial [Bacteroidota bacterium]
MNKNLLFLQLFLLLPFTTLLSQQQVVINVGEVVVNPQETTSVCVPVTVDTFNAIATLQFDIIWDSSVMTYTNIDLGDDPLSISANDYNLVEPGRWRLVWSEASLMGITLDFETEIFSLCFDFPSGVEGFTDVELDTAGTIVFAMPDV